MRFFVVDQVARKRIRRKPGNKVVLALRKASGSSRSLAVPSTNDLVTTNFSSDVSTSSPNASPDKMAANNNGMTTGVEKDCIKTEVMSKKRVHQRESIEAKRERKAAKTLAIITGMERLGNRLTAGTGDHVRRDFDSHRSLSTLASG